MNTRQLLLKHHELSQSDPKKAQAFLKEHSDNERFVSLIELGNSFVEGFREYMEERPQEQQAEKEKREAAA